MTRLRRVLSIPDCHFPHHDKTAFNLMLDVAAQFKPDEVVYLGDFFDAGCISTHEKDPIKDYKLLRDELKEGRIAMDEVERITKAKKFIFLEGNHSNRINRYIGTNAPKLGGIFSAKEVLGIPHSYGYYPYGQSNYYKIGNLTFTHGYLAGENPAGSMVKKLRSSVVFGHVHKLQIYSILDINGKEFTGIAAGWLGDQRKAAEYIKGVSDWSLGFVLTWHKDNGEFFYQTIHIQKSKHGYQCLYGNEIYQR